MGAADVAGGDAETALPAAEAEAGSAGAVSGCRESGGGGASRPCAVLPYADAASWSKGNEFARWCCC